MSKKRAMVSPSHGSLLALPVALGALIAFSPPARAAEDTPRGDLPTFTPVGIDYAADAEEPGGRELIGELALDLRDDMSATDIAALGRDLGVELTDNSPGVTGDGNVYIARGLLGEARARIMAAMGRDPRVEVAEPLMRIDALFTPNDPKFAEQWHMTNVGAERAWEYACGQGVTVAVIDTGIACYDKAPFMKGTDLASTSCTGGYNFVGKNEFAADDHGHGTHVAGTIAQSTHNAFGASGLAHCATLMPIKVLSRQGWGTSADVAEGIRWAADHGAQVVNMSLGSSSKSSVIEKSVRYALGKGVVIVAAAGNSGRSVGYPAAYPGVIAVSATDRNDKIAWFSSRGPEVTIGAPGVAVVQQTVCDAGKNRCELFGAFNGTSMASPHVAAAAALVTGMGVTDPEQIKNALTQGARAKSEKNLYGAGILDAAATVRNVATKHLLMRLGLAVGLVLLVARRINKRGGKVAKGALPTTGLLMGSVGLLPILPWLGLAGRLGPKRAWLELLSRPVGEWDLMLSIAAHKYLLLASAVPTLALALLCFQWKPMRSWLGGFAVGAAGLALSLAWTGESAFVFGPTLMRFWMVGSAGVCLWLGRVALDQRRA